MIDEYNVWTFPVVLGLGKRLFESSAAPTALRLLSTLASITGVVISTCVPSGVNTGQVPVSSFGPSEPSARELARRERLLRDVG